MISKLLPPEVAHFNPLPPHGGRLCCHFQRKVVTSDFNPLPPHGGRRGRRGRGTGRGGFQSTPSVWRETFSGTKTGLELRMEGDANTFAERSEMQNFNPLPPHGGRQQNCTGKRFSFRLSLYNPAKKDAKDYILHPKKWFFFEKREKNLVRNLQHLSVRL